VTALGGEYRRRAAEDNDIRMQLPTLYAWAHSAQVIIELGTRSGNSTAAFLAGLEHSDCGDLWSVDIERPQVPDDWYGYTFWHLLVADDLSPEALAFCPDNADVLFIDTSHYYEPTLAELRAYAPKVKPGGVILMHDTDTPGTDIAWPDVPRVLDDWCAETGLTWLNHRGWNGLGVVEIPR
jgi:predicted O-methyltransferase YrrM